MTEMISRVFAVYPQEAAALTAIGAAACLALGVLLPLAAHVWLADDGEDETR